MFRHILKGFTWAMGAQFLAIASAIAFSIVAARTLGPSGMGVLAFYLSLVFLLRPIAGWGLPLLLQREILNSETDNLALLRSSLLTRFVFGGVGCVCLLAIAVLLGRDIEEVILVGLPISLVLVVGTCGILNSAYQALKLWKLTFIISVLSVTALFIMSAITVYKDWGIEGLAWSKFAEALILSVACIYFVRKLHTSTGQTSRSMPYLIKTGTALAMTGLVVAAYSRIDQIMIAHLMNEESLGLYAVAMQFMMGWWAVGSILVTFLRPLTLNSLNTKEELDEIIEGSFLLMVLFGFSVIIFNIVFAKIIVNIFYGAEYSEVTNLLIWLSPTAMFSAMGGIRTSYMIALGQDKLYLTTTIIGLVITVIGNLALLPKFGLWGAVISLNISIFVVAVPATFMFPSLRYVGVMMLRSLFFPLGRKNFVKLTKLATNLGREN